MSSRSVLLIVALVATACGSTATDQPTPTLPAISAATASPSSTAPPSGSRATTTIAPPDLTRFIAAVDAALADTAYAGAALTDPEVFIGTGQLFCEMLDEGTSRDDILREHLEALAVVGTGELTDSDATATGVLLGVSTELICPQHAG